MIYYKDKKYKFIELFNPVNGFLYRSNDMFGNEPKARSFPELIDIGIMGHCNNVKSEICKKFGVDCYQSALSNYRENINLAKYEMLIKQMKNKTYQVALGGAGDPNKHEHFEEILKITRSNNIIPNITTSCFDITDSEVELISKYCGSAAISFYSRLINNIETNIQTIATINKFVDSGIITNVHFILSTNTIDDAIYRLENNLFPLGINAIIFILYKAVGEGKPQLCLTITNPKMRKLLDIIQENEFEFEIGFDTCFTLGVLYYNKKISINSIDFCEAGRFSMYIDSDLNASSCSFDKDLNNSYNLDNITIQQAWNEIRKTSLSLFGKCDNLKCNETFCYKKGCILSLSPKICGK